MTRTCPDCGRTMNEEAWSEELCPKCLLGMALQESSTDEGEDIVTVASERSDALAPGQILRCPRCAAPWPLKCGELDKQTNINAQGARPNSRAAPAAHNPAQHAPQSPRVPCRRAIFRPLLASPARFVLPSAA